MEGARISISSLKDKIANKLKSSSAERPKDKKKRGEPKTSQVGKNADEGQLNKLTKDKSKKKHSKKGSEVDILRQEALDLGATEEDLALIEELDDYENSEEEFEQQAEKDTSSQTKFNEELSKFMDGIGLDGNAEPLSASESESADGEVNEDFEDDEPEGNNSKSEISDSNDDDVDKDEDKSHTTNLEPIIGSKNTDRDMVDDVSTVISDKLKIPARTDWYNNIEPVSGSPEKLDRFARERLYERAEQVVDEDSKVYLQEFAANSSQKKFLTQILSDGTLSDKISALTLLAQEAPLHNIKAFDTLMGFCEKKSRTAALQAINAMKDMLLNNVLPDRKLWAFDKQPLSKDTSNKQLASYYFEDYLKKLYFKFISILEYLSHDPITYIKINVIKDIFDLLRAKPEQEVNLLRLGVNKLGDNDSKVASKTSYEILQLEQAHPAMKATIINSVVDLMLKTNIDYHARYYSVVTLNQTILTRKDEIIANTLVKTYFALFEKVLIENNDKQTDTKYKALGRSGKGRNEQRKSFKKGKKGGKSVKQEEKTASDVIEEKSSRIFSALLTGLNRAFPFSNLPDEVFKNHLDTLFKITHSSNFNTSVQALVFLNHIIVAQKLDSDRYYRTLYESLLDPRLVSSSKKGIYLNLLYKSLKNDIANPSRVLAFAKRILQISSHWLDIGAICGMLYLIMELLKDYPQIKDLTVDFASRPDPEGYEESEEKENSGVTTEKEHYDSRKRDPKFANADRSSLWEMELFLNFFHPTVSVFANSLTDGTPQQKPDLNLFTLSHFLDRFVYKNANLKPVTRGSSIMQPLGGAHTGSLLVKASDMLSRDVPANTENWLEKKAENIKPDEKFFHQYFTSKIDKLKKATSKDANKVDNLEEEAGDDEEVWQALVKSRPEVEEASDEEDLVGESDFDEDDFDLSNEDEPELDKEQDVEFSGEDEADKEDQGEDIANVDSSDGEGQIFGINEEDELSDSGLQLKMLGDDANDLSEEEEKEEKVNSKKRPKNKKEKSKRKKIKSLPLFANSEDYQQYLGSDDD